MDPAQMEGLITNYYEYHVLYISGIDHVESRNVQGVALMRLEFHPGTDMAPGHGRDDQLRQPLAGLHAAAPFVMRFDTGSVPVGYLVLSSETRSLAEIQDLALFSVRPKFARLPGVSAPPPFGGNQRTVVIDVDPERLRAYHLSPEDVIGAVSAGNTIKLTTLGGLSLAVGILVDEATVEIENKHTQIAHTPDVARAVRLGNAQTAIPRLLAMLCVLAVFLPSFFMEGTAQALFVPLSLAVGFSMLASYLLSSTFVPVASTWLLEHVTQHDSAPDTETHLVFA